MAENNIDNEWIHIGSYQYRYDGLYYNFPTKIENMYDPLRIANHTPLLVKRRILDDGINKTSDTIFSVLFKGKRLDPVSVTKKDMQSQNPDGRFDEACYIDDVRGYRNLYRHFMEIQAENAEPEHIYKRTGWIEQNGKRIFLNGCNSVTADGLTPEYNVELDEGLSAFGFYGGEDPERWTTFRRLFDVAPKAVIFPLLAMCFMSPLNKMLRDKGYEPNFVLYVVGRTGAKKTTLSILFSNFFGKFIRNQSPPIYFNATPNAAELILGLGSDLPLLVDDRKPSSSLTEKAQLEALEERILRCIGERTPRQRSTSDSNLKIPLRPNANVIVTAETAYENVGESGIARAITCELHRGDVNDDSLTYVQDHAEHLNQIMAGYIQYVIQHYDELEEKIVPMMKKMREAGQSDHPRLNDTGAKFQIAISFMCRYLIESGIFTKDEADKMLEETWCIFYKLCDEQEKRIEAETPVNMFLNAFNGILNTGSLTIVKKNGISTAWNKDWIYERDEDYCVNSHVLYSKVMEYFRDENTYFSKKHDAICKDLLEGGFLNTAGKGKTSNVVTINGNKYRLLCIRKDRLPKLIEEEN